MHARMVVGWEKVSCLERCPQFRGVLIEGFRCKVVLCVYYSEVVLCRSVCFSRSASLHHYLSGPVGNLKNKFIIPGARPVVVTSVVR